MKNAFLFLFLSALVLASFTFEARGQGAPVASGNEPIEITADGSLEWNRNEKLFIARDHAKAVQGDTSVSAAVLTARYREGEGGGMDIYHFAAEKDVELRSKDSTAYGQKADYDLDKGYAVMTGDNLRMISPDQIVSAKERFEYWVNEGKLVAVGSARADRKNPQGHTDRLEADTISAVLKDDAQGRRVLHTLEAVGHVIITTPTEKATGDHGIYHASSNKAVLTGNVVLHRRPNMLEGERAEVDLNTNTSQLFGGSASATKSGQVRGIFYPGSEKKLEEKMAPQ